MNGDVWVKQLRPHGVHRIVAPRSVTVVTKGVEVCSRSVVSLARLGRRILGETTIRRLPDMAVSSGFAASRNILLGAIFDAGFHCDGVVTKRAKNRCRAGGGSGGNR